MGKQMLARCGISTPVVCILPKDEKRVRFSYPAQEQTKPSILIYTELI